MRGERCWFVARRERRVMVILPYMRGRMNDATPDDFIVCRRRYVRFGQ